MKKIIQYVVAVVMSLAFSGMAAAAGITAKQVENYMASMPELELIGDKYPQPQDIDRYRPLGSALELMDKKSEAYSELSALAKKHDFSNVKQWADVGDRVMQAYLILSSNLSLEEVQAGYQVGVDNINKDPKISDENKRKILARMEKTHSKNIQMRKQAEPDLAVVKPYLGQLDALFNN